MKSPEVIVRTKYLYSLNNPDRKFKIISKKYVNTMLDYYIDDKKRAIDLIDYYTRTGKYNKSSQVNLVLETGEYATKDELVKRKKNIERQIENSNLWQVVVSFDNNYIDSHIKLSDLERLMAKEIMPKFLKNIGFQNTKNIMYQMSLHTNTDNYHFHIAFMEKKPSSLNSKDKLVYRRLGKISRSSINFLKNETLLSIEREHEFKKHIIEINKDIVDIKNYFKENTYNFLSKENDKFDLENQLSYLGDLLSIRSTASKIKFNSIKNKEIVNLTKEISQKIFKNDPELKKMKNEFDRSLNRLNDYLKELSVRNKMEDYNNSIIKRKKEYLNNYVYNAIINTIYHARTKVSKQEKNGLNSKDNVFVSKNVLMQQIILKNHVHYNRKERLINHLNYSYPNLEQLKKSIKSINQDIENDIKEFEKLFIQNKELNI